MNMRVIYNDEEHEPLVIENVKQATYYKEKGVIVYVPMMYIEQLIMEVDDSIKAIAIY